ncbi:hypothetical protein [Demequina phytophila]|nr:hypothetical protein [Demequina phytophila]
MNRYSIAVLALIAVWPFGSTASLERMPLAVDDSTGEPLWWTW